MHLFNHKNVISRKITFWNKLLLPRVPMYIISAKIIHNSKSISYYKQLIV